MINLIILRFNKLIYNDYVRQVVDKTVPGEKKDTSIEMTKAYDPDYVEAAWLKKNLENISGI